MAVSTWAAGERITADRLNQITARYSTWTPTWTTSTGLHSPSFGNATITCSYCQTGDLVVCKFDILFGSTTNFGSSVTSSDNWRFTVPVTASATAHPNGMIEVNYDGSNNHNLVCRARLTTTTTIELQIVSGETDGVAPTNTGIVDSLTPGTWTSAGLLRGNIIYQAA